MHRILLSLFLLTGTRAVAQQDSVPLPPPPPIDLETLPSNDGSNTRLEKQPEFPGGQQALTNYLQTTIRYPEEMREANIQGRVYVGFTIAASGAVTNAEVKRGIPNGKPLEEEALRVVRAMPAWTPATVNGVPVPTEYILPVMFQLND